MNNRRFKILVLVFAALAYFVCGFSAVRAAEPMFNPSISYSSITLSQFPNYDKRKLTELRPRFVSSITPTEYMPLTLLYRGEPYEYSFDYNSGLVTFTKIIDANSKLVPVSSDYDNFIERFLSLRRSEIEHESLRKSLSKDQKKKAGGLIHFTIPIQSRAFESIFGEGGASLKVSGYRKISFAGRSTWTDKASSALQRQSKFPTLQMEQLYRFNIEGTIGSKITVKVNQDSNNDIPLANKLLLRYKGGEDDVLQTLEAGNTTLNLPATRFLQYSTRVQGLFGLKASMKIADLTITAIASQEKGTTETIEFSSGGSIDATRVIKDVLYKKYTFYDLGRIPRIPQFTQLSYPDRPLAGDTPADGFIYDFLPGDTIIEVEVYLDDNTSNDAERLIRQPGICYVTPPPGDTLSSDTSGSDFRVVGYFEEVETNKYYVSKGQFYIQFLQPIVSNDDILGVYMKVKRATGQIEEIGQKASGGDSLRLKLIKPQSYIRPNNHIWEYEWKNVYDLGARNIDLNDLKVEIFRGQLQSSNTGDPDALNNQNGVNYLSVFGLDLGDNSGVGTPDNEIDRNTRIIQRDLGLLIFPMRHPFDSRIVLDTGKTGPNKTVNMVYLDNLTDTSTVITLNDSVPDLYRSSNLAVVNSSSQFYIAVTTKGRGSSQIDLGSANIIEGSEVITFNGQRLVRGKDYNLDANFGRLTLLDDKYTDVGANLSIMFEKAPFFSLAKKTLLGTRFEYSPSRDFRIGTTILYKSDKSTSRKPKIGEETSKILVWDVDFNYKFNNSLMTKLVDIIPFYKAKAQSFMQLSGELAQSRPNPNVDGEVYIDDFEGSSDKFSLGISRIVWRHPSKPLQLTDSSAVRGKVSWLNPFNEILFKDIYRPKPDQVENTYANILRVKYKPVEQYLEHSDTTIDGTVSTVVDTLDIKPEHTWNGFMRNIPTGVTQQLRDVQLLEMRINGERGIMHIDLGLISEDIDNDGQRDDEDTKSYGILDEANDIGLDGLTNENERPIYLDADNLDPAGDNYRTNDEWKINGTEGNGNFPSDPNETYYDSDRGNVPDSEDPDGYGFNTTNRYFSYQIDLSTDQFEVPDTRYTADVGSQIWKTIRIPLRDPEAVDTIIGDPTWDEIQFVRIWFDSADGTNVTDATPWEIQIASMDLVSTTWADSLFIADSLRGGNVGFDVAVINDEINSNYTSPPNVEGYYDQTQNITEAEQSLLLSYQNLNARVLINTPDSGIILAADTGLAVRHFLRASNFMGYGRLQAFVHGPSDVSSDSMLFFFRLGSDKNAYYEYRTLLKPGWDIENFVDIDFEVMTGIKARLINDIKSGEDSTLSRLDESGKYLVKVKNNFRDPTLTSVRYFAMGVINLDTTQTATGEVWIDELRLTDVKNDVGMAARFTVNGNMSDLITYNFSYSNQDAYYRGVSNATKGGAANNLGSGNTKTSYSLSGSFNLHNLFPRSLEMRMPISFNWSENIQEPLLRSGTDITVPEDLKKEETSVTISKGIGVSQSFKKKTKNILFTALLNRLQTSFKFNVTTGHSPNQPSFSRERYTASAKYNLNLKKQPSIKLLKWTEKIWAPFGISKTKLYLYPTRWDFTGALSGSYSETMNQSLSIVKTTKLDFRGNMNFGFKIFDNLSGSYSFNTNRDLKDPRTVNLTVNPKKFKLGVEQSYGQSFKVTYSPRLFNFLSHKADYSSNYSDSYRSNRDSTFYHDVTVKSSINFNLGFDHTKFLGTNKKRRGNRRTKNSEGILGIIKLPLKGVRIITDNIEPIKGSYRINRGLANPGLSDKASLKYRFGLTEDPEIGTVDNYTGLTSQNKSLSRGVTASSGIKLFSGISASVKYSRDTKETFVSNPSINVSETWPDVNFNLRTMRGLWYFGKLMNFLSPASRYSRSVSTRQKKSAQYINTKTVKQAYNPLFSFSLNPKRSMRVTIKIDQSFTDNKSFNDTNGEISNYTKKSNINYGFILSYSFRSPGGIKLPFLGRLKFESSMTLSLDISYRQSATEASKGEDENGTLNFTKTEDKSSINIQPKASYSFSSTVKGGLSMRWQDSTNAIRNEKSHTREVSIWVEMRF